MEGGLRVHEVDLRQSLPTVLKAMEIRFGKFDASMNEVVAELRRLGRESGEQCQGTEALKANVASACHGSEAPKAMMAKQCQGTEALKPWWQVCAREPKP